MNKTFKMIILALATGVFSFAAIVFLFSKQYLGAFIFFILSSVVSTKFRSDLNKYRNKGQTLTADQDIDHDIIAIKLVDGSSINEIKDRQEILRKIKFNENPYDKLKIELEKTSN